MFRRKLLFAFVVMFGCCIHSTSQGSTAKPPANLAEYEARRTLLLNQKDWLDSLAAAEARTAAAELGRRRARLESIRQRELLRAEEFASDTTRGDAFNRRRPRESFILASLIRTITTNSENGEATSREFLDVRLRLVGGPTYFTMANLDADMLQGEQTGADRLRDASFSLNWVPGFSSQYNTSRVTFLGGLFRIFDGTSYYGFQAGGQELKLSTLAPSVVSGAVLWPMTSTARETFVKHNGQPAALLVDFFVSDSTPEAFLSKLNLRGSVLFDLEHGHDPLYRFVVEVPFAKLQSVR